MARIDDLRKRLERERQAGLRANRWGEARRFAGRMAGNRLDRIERIRRMIDKEYTRLAKTNKEEIE